MTYTDQKSCMTCAWRETCQKRFSSTEDLGLRCPEYTFDVRLKKNIPADAPDEPISGLNDGRKK
jgi:hypothetical protein